MNWEGPPRSWDATIEAAGTVVGMVGAAATLVLGFRGPNKPAGSTNKPAGSTKKPAGSTNKPAHSADKPAGAGEVAAAGIAEMGKAAMVLSRCAIARANSMVLPPRVCAGAQPLQPPAAGITGIDLAVP